MRAEDYEWSESEEGMVHQRGMRWVDAVIDENEYIYDRFVKLAWLYNPDRRSPDAFQQERNVGRMAMVQENVIADNVDSICGVMSTKDVRARFLSDGADWSTQRRLHALELYSEDLKKHFRLKQIGMRVFQDCALKATGVGCVDRDRKGRTFVERVMIDEIVVDPVEANGGMPPQMGRLRYIPKRKLKQLHPEKAEEIERLTPSRGRETPYYADDRPTGRQELRYVQLWILPVGDPDDDDYVEGRYVAFTDGLDLDDQPYNKPHYPFVFFKWEENPDGFHGIGAGSRIIGHQRTLNRTNWQIDRSLTQNAVPTTWFHKSDRKEQTATVNEFGTCGTYNTKIPVTQFPPAVHPETYQRRHDTIESAFNSYGQSRMQATAMKPPGLDSGAALREYRDSTTDRFGTQEAGFEEWQLEMMLRILESMKDQAEDGIEPPVATIRGRSGRRQIRWSDVDPGEMRVSIEAASTLARTPAGRIQQVQELAQAGIISQDEARRLMDQPDLERALSLYNAALEYVEFCLEDILDGQFVAPSPEMNLEMCVWRGEAQYQLSAMNGAPERVLENLHSFIVLAAYQIDLKSQAAANQNAQMMAAAPGAMDPAMMPPPGAGPLPPPPPGAPPVTGAGVMPLQLAG